MEVRVDVPGAASAVFAAMRTALGAEAAGKPVDTQGVTGQVERIGENQLLLRLTDPVPGLLGFAAFDKGNGSTMAAIQGWLFSEHAAAYIEREQPAWKAWLEGLAIPAT